MKEKQLHQMPEAMINVYALQRDQYREIIRGYHNTGNHQLAEGSEHLLRGLEALPEFRDQTFEELRDQIMREQGLRRYDERALESPPREAVHDPNQIRLNLVRTEVDWYRAQPPANVLHYSATTTSFVVAPHLGALNDFPTYQVRTAPAPQCTCDEGPHCSHYAFVAERVVGNPVTDDWLLRGIRRSNKEKQKTSKRGGKKDWGRKKPLRESQTDPGFPTTRRRPGMLRSSDTDARSDHDSASALSEATSRSSKASRSSRGTRASRGTGASRGTRASRGTGASRATGASRGTGASRASTRGSRAASVPEQQQALPVIPEGDEDMDLDASEIGTQEAIEAALSLEEGVERDQTGVLVSSQEAFVAMLTVRDQLDSVQEGVVVMDQDDLFGSSTLVYFDPETSSVPVVTTGSRAESPTDITRVDTAESPEHRTETTGCITSDGCLDIETVMANPHVLNDIPLHFLEGRFVSKNGEKIALIKTDQQTRPKIMVDSDMSPEEIQQVKFIAAKMAVEGAELHEGGQKLLTYKLVPVKRNNFERQTTAEMNNAFTKVSGTKTENIAFACKCDHPVVNNVLQEGLDLTCNNCEKQYHSACLDNPPQTSTSTFHCPPCTTATTFKGLNWSEKNDRREQIQNTCTVDNQLTGLILHEKLRNPQITTAFWPDDRDHTALKQATELAKKGDSYSAQKTLYDMYNAKNTHFIKNHPNYEKIKKQNAKLQKENDTICTKNEKLRKEKKAPLPLKTLVPQTPPPYPDLSKDSIYGNPRDYWSKTFQAGCTFSFAGVCDNQRCRESDENLATHQHYQINCEEFAQQNTTLSELLPQIAQGGLKYPCQQCHAGTKTATPLQGWTGHEWMLDFDLETVGDRQRNHFKREVINNQVPKKLQVGDRSYSLSTIIFHQAPGHYVSMQYDNESDSMMFYDGKIGDKKSSKFYEASLDQIMDTTPVSLQYFRDN